MSTNTYIDPVFTTELREWIQNDTFVYEGSKYDIDVVLPAWNKGLPKEMQPFYGKTLTEEHKNKCSESSKGEKNAFYGKKHSEETKAKWSAKRKGVSNHTEYQREKIRESNRRRAKLKVP